MGLKEGWREFCRILNHLADPNDPRWFPPTTHRQTPEEKRDIEGEGWVELPPDQFVAVPLGQTPDGEPGEDREVIFEISVESPTYVKGPGDTEWRRMEEPPARPAFNRWPGRVPENSQELILAIRLDGVMHWTQGIQDALGNPTHVIVLTRRPILNHITSVGLQADPTKTGLPVLTEDREGFRGTYFAKSRSALEGAGVDLDPIHTTFARWATIREDKAFIDTYELN